MKFKFFGGPVDGQFLEVSLENLVRGSVDIDEKVETAEGVETESRRYNRYDLTSSKNLTLHFFAQEGMSKEEIGRRVTEYALFGSRS